MPTYDYKCKQCKHTMEVFQSMKDDALVECPECHTPNLVRIIGNGSGLIFKGKGFYQTDYKSNGSVTATSGTSKAKDESSSTGSSEKTETPAAPAAKTDSPASSTTKTDAGSGGTTKKE
jgi:putative FmdB family regulatory protein